MAAFLKAVNLFILFNFIGIITMRELTFLSPNIMVNSTNYLLFQSKKRLITIFRLLTSSGTIQTWVHFFQLL